MVAGVRLAEPRIAPRRRPVERAAVHDDAAERRTVPADELGRAVHDDIRAVLDGADQIRRTEGVVDDERNAVRVGDGGERVDVGDVAVRVAERLDVECLGVGTDRGFDLVQVVDVDERGLDAVERERVREQVRAAAVDGLLRDDVLPLRRERLDRVGDRRRAGGDRKSGDAALERRDARLEHALRGVGQPPVDVARVGEAEAVGGVLRAVEDVGRGGVDGHSPRVARGIGGLLPDVELERFKFVVRHDIVPFPFVSCFRHGSGRAKRAKVFNTFGNALKFFCLLFFPFRVMFPSWFRSSEKGKGF